MIPRAMQAFVDFYDGAFGCEGMSICRSMDRTHSIDTIFYLANTDGHCGSICLSKTYGWLIHQDPDLVQGLNTDLWMDPYLPTLVELKRIITRPVPKTGLENLLLYFCQKGN